MKKIKLSILITCFIALSCSKKNDDLIIPDTVNANPEAGVEVQDFMWKAMNYWYFWYNSVPDLADDRFPITEEGSEAYTQFLLSEEDPASFFTNKLQFSEDRFSFFSDDYTELTNALAGISKSNGLEFGLIALNGGDDIFGVVRYIIPGSDAATKAIARGDIFNGVNGETLNRSNFRNLLFGDADTYTLNLANLVDGEITADGKEVTLTKEEALSENPVFIDKIFEINEKKIGYFMYNGFTNEFDEDLNDAFGRFKSGGVTDLVVDLRYNPGGDVNSATLLASMIYGTNTNDVFLKARYNDKYQAVLAKNNTDVRRFFNNKTPGGTTVNTLNLSKVYILTSLGSASASELVINGLAPYMEVVQIGDLTRGKNEFSITMVDDRANRYIFNRERESKIKQGNRWAIQPLIGRNENAEGFSAYTEGLVPDIELKEDLTNMGLLGDQNEPLLARAIAEITGVSGKTDFTIKMPLNEFTNSTLFKPLKDNMHITELPYIEPAP